MYKPLTFFEFLFISRQVSIQLIQFLIHFKALDESKT